MSAKQQHRCGRPLKRRDRLSDYCGRVSGHTGRCRSEVAEAKVLAVSKAEGLKSRRANPREHMVYEARKRAKAKGIACSITPSDIHIPDACPVFGVPFTVAAQNGQGPWNRSLDRIDQTQGYVPGNVQVISKLANSMKRDATLAELRQFAEWALRLCDEHLIHSFV